MDRQDALDAMVRRSREAVRRDPSGAAELLARELAEQALYAEAGRYVQASQQVRRGKSRQGLLRARQQALGAAALAYAHPRGWQPPADW